MGRILVGTVIVTALLFSACGDDNDVPSAGSTSTTGQRGAATAAKRVQERDCITPSRAAIKALEESLSGGGRLLAARALPSADSYQGPTELREGAVFIAAKLGANASLVWLTTRDFVGSGEGLAVAASKGTRRVSSLGADEDPSLIGISPESRGLAEVRECVNERFQATEAKARLARERRDEQRARARRVAARRALRQRQGAARRQREADRRATDETTEPDAAPEAPAMSGGTCADTSQKNIPVPPGDPRDRDGDGIGCES